MSASMSASSQPERVQHHAASGRRDAIGELPSGGLDQRPGSRGCADERDGCGSGDSRGPRAHPGRVRADRLRAKVRLSLSRATTDTSEELERLSGRSGFCWVELPQPACHRRGLWDSVLQACKAATQLWRLVCWKEWVRRSCAVHHHLLPPPR
eukprot:6422800-Pyramimonas_sp.AAC.1